MVTASRHDMEIEPKNVPADYQPGFLLPFIIEESPLMQMKTFSLTGGKYFVTGKRKNIWVTVEGGISLVQGEVMTFTQQPVEYYLFYMTSNYDVATDTKTAMGFLLKADLNCAFLRYAGFGGGVFANINSIRSIFGIQFKFLIGWMNRNRK
jgi:hypothetical protein